MTGLLFAAVLAAGSMCAGAYSRTARRHGLGAKMTTLYTAMVVGAQAGFMTASALGASFPLAFAAGLPAAVVLPAAGSRLNEIEYHRRPVRRESP